MQSPLADEFHKAVYFLSDGQVQRELRFTEFEAFLDGYVGLSDLASTEVKAVYGLVSNTLGPSALLFFRIYFDDEGRADSSWNIPLDELISQAGSGPDLGEGPIRLVCRSRCPDPKFADMLWDPEMSPGRNDFQAIRKCIEANGLRFMAKPSPAEVEIPVLTATPVADDGSPSGTSADQRVRLARLIRQQRLRIKTLQSAHRDATRETHREHRLELQELRREHLEMEQQLERLKLSNTHLKQKLAERNEQYLELQQQASDFQARAPAEQTQAELVLLREQLERKEREAEQRRDLLAQLQEQVQQLQQAVPDEDSLLGRLQSQSVFLVAYHAGVGHITLPYAEIERYFANPVGYAAARCDLAQPAYERWLAHYENPLCQAKKGRKTCGAPLLRVSDPREFRPGADDLCDSHRKSGTRATAAARTAK